MTVRLWNDERKTAILCRGQVDQGLIRCGCAGDLVVLKEIWEKIGLTMLLNGLLDTQKLIACSTLLYSITLKTSTLKTPPGRLEIGSMLRTDLFKCNPTEKLCFC